MNPCSEQWGCTTDAPKLSLQLPPGKKRGKEKGGRGRRREEDKEKKEDGGVGKEGREGERERWGKANFPKVSKPG